MTVRKPRVYLPLSVFAPRNMVLQMLSAIEPAAPLDVYSLASMAPKRNIGKRDATMEPKRVKKTVISESVMGSPARMVTTNAAAKEAIITWTFIMQRTTRTTNPTMIAKKPISDLFYFFPPSASGPPTLS